LLDLFTKEICQIYGLRSFQLTSTHPADQLGKMEPGELMQMFVLRNSMTRGSLAGAQWTWNGNALHIKLLANGKDAVEELIPQVQMELQQRFDTPVSITVEAGQDLKGQALFDAMEKIRGSMIEQAPQNTPAEKKEVPVPVVTDAVFGKSFKGTAIPMKDIDLNMGNVIVEGRVFALDHKELPKRNAVVIKFDMTDNTSSIRVSRFLERKEADPIMKEVKVGSIVKVIGRLMIDNYTNEMVLKPNAIMAGTMPKRKDTAPGEKRVELHLHTVMSNMDALTETKAAIKQAAAWGHKAIAITDHGCVQSFTDALHVVEDWKGAPKVAGTDQTIKILYGCEGYYINDVDDRLAVHGKSNMTFDSEYVAFDLETTGLYRHDTIIEIGAVRMKEGVEIERFQTFVDPKRRLHPKVIELTGITDDMLKGAPALEEILPKFREFVGNSVLVAHNADFDANFIRRACEQLGIDWDMTFVDTLTISQCLMPEMSKFRLDIVAKKFDLADFNHHRAGDDALVCGRIAGRLFQMLQERGISDIQSINEAMLPLRPVHRQDVVKCQHIVLFAKNQIGL
jgi:DNA polymerase-3 subunit alpha (Gram-positive type)